MKNTENWKPVVGYEDYYQVSDLGRIKSLDRVITNSKGNPVKRGKILKLGTYKTGYKYVNLSQSGEAKKYKVHRLVASAFVTNPANHSQVNHINGDKGDNRAHNLEWCTQSENTKHAIENKLQVNANNKHPFAKKIAVYKNGAFVGEYQSIRSMCKELSLDRKTVKRVISGVYNDTKGYSFRNS